MNKIDELLETMLKYTLIVITVGFILSVVYFNSKYYTPKKEDGIITQTK